MTATATKPAPKSKPKCDVDLGPAYAAATRALCQHSDRYDSIRDIAVTVVDAAAAAMEKCEREALSREAEENKRLNSLRFIQENRDGLIKALAAQARREAAEGLGAEKGFYDSELIRAADWLDTLLAR